MDMSKLPKLSQTPATPPQDEPVDAQSTPSPLRAKDAGSTGLDGFSMGDIWFSLIVGVIFLLIGRSFGEYSLAKLSHRPYHTGQVWSDEAPKAGQEVEYPELTGNPMLTDSAMFLFGLAIVLDAGIRVAVLRRARFSLPLAYVGFALSAGVTVYNLYVAGVLLKGGVLPLMSLLAVAFGGYVAFSEWQLIKALRQVRKMQT
jgi:hypothetical protein